MRRQADARGVPADIMMPRVLLVVATILLVLIGLVMVFSASTIEAISQGDSIFSYVGKQALFAVGGAIAIAFIIAKFIPYHMRNGGLGFRLSCGVALPSCCWRFPFVGTEMLGAKRWISYRRLQPPAYRVRQDRHRDGGRPMLYDYRNEFRD